MKLLTFIITFVYISFLGFNIACTNQIDNTSKNNFKQGFEKSLTSGFKTPIHIDEFEIVVSEIDLENEKNKVKEPSVFIKKSFNYFISIKKNDFYAKKTTPVLSRFFNSYSSIYILNRSLRI